MQYFYSILFIKTYSKTVCCVALLVPPFVHLPDAFIQSGSQLNNNTIEANYPRGTET